MLKWTRHSCTKFAASAVRFQLHALAYNLANFLWTTATPELIERWSLISLRERLIDTGALVAPCPLPNFLYARGRHPA